MGPWLRLFEAPLYKLGTSITRVWWGFSKAGAGLFVTGLGDWQIYSSDDEDLDMCISVHAETSAPCEDGPKLPSPTFSFSASWTRLKAQMGLRQPGTCNDLRIRTFYFHITGFSAGKTFTITQIYSSDMAYSILKSWIICIFWALIV